MEPSTVIEALNQGVDLVTSGQTLGGAIALIYAIMFAIKKYIPADKKKYIPVVTGFLGIIIAVLTKVVAGMSWPEAIIIMAAGPGSSWAHDCFELLRPKK